MRLLFYYPLLGFLFFIQSGCQPFSREHPRARQNVIAVLPFTDTNHALNLAVCTSLEKRIKIPVILLAPVSLPSNAFLIPRNRYRAGSLLAYGKSFNNGKYARILMITTADISIPKNGHASWGIMGLAEMGGGPAVISSARPKRTAESREHLIQQMLVLALHELGHTWSLPHCPQTGCLMKDAEGKMNLDWSDQYCNSCAEILNRSGVLR